MRTFETTGFQLKLKFNIECLIATQILFLTFRNFSIPYIYLLNNWTHSYLIIRDSFFYHGL